jgi:RHS repeat-associated protein
MRLRQRVEYTWNGSAWATNGVTLYVYDGNLVVQEQDQNHTPKVSYTRGRDLSGSLQGAGGIGGLLARTDNSASTHAYYHADGNGNITCLIDTNQAVAAAYLYDPYGKILNQSGPLADANLYRFSSKEFHVNSGMYCYPYRFYDPALQRWPNRDPINEPAHILLRRNPGEDIVFSQAEEVNLYELLHGDPVNKLDPLGLGDFTNADCREACESAFGCNNAAYQICLKICKTLKGKTCNALWRYCGHIATHGDFGNQGGKVCYSLYDVLCPGR